MRRWSTVVMGMLVVLIWWSGIGLAAVVSPEIWQKAQTAGVVRVIVQLNVPWRPEGKLSPQAVTAQRQAIATAQTAVLSDLVGTTYRITGQLWRIPGIGLAVGPNALAVLNRSPRVVSVVEDRPVPPLLPQSVPLVEANQAWAAGFDGTGESVAILDTGVNGTHPFLAGKVVAEACFSGNSNCPNGTTQMIGPGAGVPCTYAVSGCTHGTHVAGIAAGQGATFSGVAKGANVIAIQVFSRFTGPDCAGAGEDPCAKSFPMDQILGLQHLFTLQPPLEIPSVNMSLGGGQFFDQASCDAANPMMKMAIDDLRAFGIATVIASGNDGFTNALNAPGCISTAVSVGATTKTDVIWVSPTGSSNSASFLSLLAPGASICSSVPVGTGPSDCSPPVNDFQVKSGTSMAAPHVAGAWAILKQRFRLDTVAQILNALQTRGLQITDPRNGLTQCRIRILQALNNVPATVTTIDFTGANATEAHGINNCGQIAGEFEDAAFNLHGFLLSGGVFAQIDVPGATFTEAFGINNSGQIVGEFRNATGTHGFLALPPYGPSNFTTIDPPGSVFTSAFGINDSGQIVGEFRNATGTHGFLALPPYGPSNFTTIDFPGAGATTAHGINNAGPIVGGFVDATGSHGFLARPPYGPSNFTTIDVPGAVITVARGINSAGQIVGFFTDATRSHGFLLSGGVFTTIDPPGATQTEAFGINDSSQIVGEFFDGTKTHGFLDLDR